MATTKISASFPAWDERLWLYPEKWLLTLFSGSSLDSRQCPFRQNTLKYWCL